MKKYFVLIPLLLVAAACNKTSTVANTSVAAKTYPQYTYTHKLQIGNAQLNVEIADTDTEREQGLSDQPSMQNNNGVLFEFESSSIPNFWMKDMDFDLDFIWINNGKVLGITPNVPKPTNCPAENQTCLPFYAPPSPVNWVVEANSSWAKQNNIVVGDDVKLVK